MHGVEEQVVSEFQVVFDAHGNKLVRVVSRENAEFEKRNIRERRSPTRDCRNLLRSCTWGNRHSVRNEGMYVYCAMLQYDNFDSKVKEFHMPYQFAKALVLTVLLSASNAYASAPNSQVLIGQLSSSFPIIVEEAAETIMSTGVSDSGVLDVLAEVVLQNFVTTDGDWASAIAYSCKTLGASGNKRYYDAVKEAAENPQAVRAVRKHCGKAVDSLKGPSDEQYVKNMAKLSKFVYTSDKPSPECKNIGAFGYGKTKARMHRCNFAQAELWLKTEAARRGANYVQEIEIRDYGLHCIGSAEAFICPPQG